MRKTLGDAHALTSHKGKNQSHMSYIRDWDRGRVGAKGWVLKFHLLFQQMRRWPHDKASSFQSDTYQITPGSNPGRRKLLLFLLRFTTEHGC